MPLLAGRAAVLAMVEIGPGEAYVIEPGHGDERLVGFEFESRSAEEYAKG